jgi:pantoate--beta-alanine ligase
MRTISKIEQMQRIADRLRRGRKTIALVPTMGFLHEGHLSLVDIAARNADVVVASIFVNPTQFAPNEDLKQYPRDIKRDKRLLRERGCNYLFYPDARSMYGEHYKTEVFVRDLSRVLCGVRRKAHFKGVTTIVCKLFNIVKPDIAVFGQKDAQQAIIIKRMVKDLNFDITVEVGKTVREPDGLAMSSRNIYLTEQQRREAVVLYQALKKARSMVRAGERSPVRVEATMKKMISEKKTARLDYIHMVSTLGLQPVKRLQGEVLIAVACFFGRARLIDNTIVRIRK